MKRILSFDLIRILAISLIILFHYNNCFNPIPFGLYHGSVGSKLFFLLSGYLLRLQYPKYKSLKEYYLKRFKSIYPLLIVTFLVFYFFHSLLVKNFFYGGEFYKIIFSFLGIDRYLEFFNIKGYALTGEWFTVAIVYLYIIYPLLNKLMDKHIWTSTIVFFAFFLWAGVIKAFPFNHYAVYPDARFLVVTFIFWIGMLLEWINKRYPFNLYFLPFTLILILLIRFNFNDLTITKIMPIHLIYAVCIFITVYVLTKNIHFGKISRSVIIFLSKISFTVYLIHHEIIYLLMPKFVPLIHSLFSYFFFLFVIVAITLFLAVLFYFLTDFIIDSISSLIQTIKKNLRNKKTDSSIN